MKSRKTKRGKNRSKKSRGKRQVKRGKKKVGAKNKREKLKQKRDNSKLFFETMEYDDIDDYVDNNIQGIPDQKELDKKILKLLWEKLK